MRTLAILCLALQTLHPRTVFPVTTAEQAIDYARQTEQNPLAPEAEEKRKQVIAFTRQEPQGIEVCTIVLEKLGKGKTRHAKEIGEQMIVSASRYFYEHPSHTQHQPAQELAGLESALNAYEKFLAADPAARTSYMDKLLKMRSGNKLPAYIEDEC